MIRGTAVYRALILYTVFRIARHDEYRYIEAFSGIACSSQGNTWRVLLQGPLHNRHNRHWRDLRNWKVSDAAHPFG